MLESEVIFLAQLHKKKLECKIAFAVSFVAGLLSKSFGQAVQHRKYIRTSGVKGIYFS
jgi:hypothetical protein